jgi:hypothetical protein
MRPGFALTLDIQLEEVAIFAFDADQVRWNALRSPANRLKATLMIVAL